MKTTRDFINSIEQASNDNDLFGLIKIHDDMVTDYKHHILRVVKHLKQNSEIVYAVFSQASSMSKKHKNGVFNYIIKSALKKEAVTS